MKDVMKMSAPGANIGGSATPLGGATAAVGDGWGWGVLGNKVRIQGNKQWHESR